MNKNAMKNELDMIDLTLLSTNNKTVSGKSERKVVASNETIQNSSKKA